MIRCCGDAGGRAGGAGCEAALGVAGVDGAAAGRLPGCMRMSGWAVVQVATQWSCAVWGHAGEIRHRSRIKLSLIGQLPAGLYRWSTS